MGDGHVDDVDPHAFTTADARWLVRKALAQATPRRMGLISYHRAGVAERQASAAVRASRRIGDALQDVQSPNDHLIELVNQQAEMIERLETERDELRQRGADR